MIASQQRADAPILALTIGDPVGIGPEIVARTLAEPPDDVIARGLAVGDARSVRRAAKVSNLDVQVRSVERVADARFEPGVIDVLEQDCLSTDLPWGKVQAEAGRAAIAAIESAATAALRGEVAAVVTAPINKEAIWAAGSRHLGHTEMLAEITGSARVQTVFLIKGLKVFFTTRHSSLREAIDAITRERVGQAITDAWEALTVLGQDHPSLAVAALNPHGGEGGAFGREEIDHIEPACDDARRAGLPVAGPIAADTVFHHGLQGRYDAVLSHYHDQGHIAAKTVDFEGAVTVTMGLPIVRTSVDHGTAFDIAGSGKASHLGMIAAFRAGASLAPYAKRVRDTYQTIRPRLSDPGK